MYNPTQDWAKAREQERMEREYKSWIDNCLRCGKPMRVSRTGNHYCQKCRRAQRSMTGRGYPTKYHYPAKAIAKALGLEW